MDGVLRALDEELAVLDARLGACSVADWARMTPCEGWDITDVVLHLAQTNELAVASVGGRTAALGDDIGAGVGVGVGVGVDDAAAAAVAAARGVAPADLLTRWRESAAAMRSALASADPHTRVTWVAGRLSVHTLATTRLAETWIHGGDVAVALGGTPTASDALAHIARLAWRTLPYAFRRSGRPAPAGVAFDLTGPDGAAWSYRPPDGDARTVVRGPALDLCLVAGRRLAASDSALRAEGPDATATLELVRTYA